MKQKPPYYAHMCAFCKSGFSKLPRVVLLLFLRAEFLDWGAENLLYDTPAKIVLESAFYDADFGWCCSPETEMC